MSNPKWHRVGEVYVDSGTVMVVDPCYVLPDKRDTFGNPNKNGLDYMKAVQLEPEGAYEESRQAEQDGRYAEAFMLPDNIHGYVLPSGFGDGAYPLYIRGSDEGDWGMRVTGLFVDFSGIVGENDEDEPDFYGDNRRN